MHKDHKRYVDACDFPATLDEDAVESHLKNYLSALGVERKIVRLRAGWSLDDHPALKKNVHAILDELQMKQPSRLAALDARNALDALDARDALDALDARDARNALDARAARDALDARNALDALGARAARNALAALDARAARAARAVERFAAWCVQASRWWRWDLSRLATTHFGAKTEAVRSWATPLFESYVAGAWLLYWTEDTVYWVAKPTVSVDRSNGRRRLHCAVGPAVESDVENLYFLNGVLVPAFVVTHPEWITKEHIEQEENAEVRRVMIERYGAARYVVDSDSTIVDFTTADHALTGLRDAKLLVKTVQDDEDIVYVDLLNSTPEPDGSVKRYMLRVDPKAYSGAASKSAHAAVASTWRNKDGSLFYKSWQDYRPLAES